MPICKQPCRAGQCKHAAELTRTHQNVPPLPWSAHLLVKNTAVNKLAVVNGAANLAHNADVTQVQPAQWKAAARGQAHAHRGVVSANSNLQAAHGTVRHDHPPHTPKIAKRRSSQCRLYAHCVACMLMAAAVVLCRTRLCISLYGVWRQPETHRFGRCGSITRSTASTAIGDISAVCWLITLLLRDLHSIT